jgi:hypothetical protein
MDAVTAAYVLSSALAFAAGLTMVGMAVRAYRHTERRAMLVLSVGFTVVAAATVTTAVSAFVNDFATPRSLLLVDSGMTTSGLLLVLYSLVSYR